MARAVRRQTSTQRNEDQKDGYGTAGLRVVTQSKSTQKKRGEMGRSCLPLDEARRGVFIRRARSIQNEYSTRIRKYEKER